MQIRLLGGFVVVRDGVIVPAREWRLRKARTLVKLLALTADQRLHRDVLLETLWPGRDPVSAANNLHQVLHAARKVLAGDGSVELRDDVVALSVHGLVDVDVRRFEQLRARAGGDLAGLRAAVGAYAGDLLPEDRFEDWAVRRREELRSGFCDLLVDLAELTADGEEARAAAGRALEVDPLQERAVRVLMRLLAGDGRRSEALTRYEQLRKDLREAYGTDPDLQTRRLYRDLLADSPPEEPAGTNLVPALTSFVGREREIADVDGLVARGGLTTLTGVGGAGKTRLAEEVARGLLPAYANGVWIVELAGVGDPHLVADTVAAALRLEPAAGDNPLRTLVGRLASQRLLLLLDNCEHLLNACAELAVAIRRACPGVTILATSREPLHVAGEVTFRVPSLVLPEPADAGDPARLATAASVRLFRDRARDVRPDFVIDEAGAAAVVQICRRLDGIPLALELAAARVSHLEVVEIAERLSEALTLLGRRGAVDRHATLRAALQWSHDLLGDDEQILLRRLAVFAGGFTLRMAEQVCADARLPRAEILDCLGRIVDKSLVHIERAGDRSRYRLLETIRQLARERLVAAGEVEPFEAAHFGYFLDLAVRNDPERTSGLVEERPQLLDADHDNLRAALAWAVHRDRARALSLAVSLWQYWLARGHFAEGAGWLDRILDGPPVLSSDLTRAYFALAVLEARRGRSDRLATLGAAGVQAADGEDVAYARLTQGTLLLGVAELDDVERTAGEIHDDSTDPATAAAASWLAAMVALFREDADLARQRFTRFLDGVSLVSPAAAPFLAAVTPCLTLMPAGALIVPAFEETWLLGRRVGAVQGHAYAMSALGYAHRLAGDLTAAVATTTLAVEEFAKIGDTAGLAHALNHLGCVERDAASFDAADDHLREALRLRRQLGDRRGENLSLANLGLLCAAAGDVAQGRRHARAALDQGESVEDGPGIGGGLLNLAVVELLGGDRHRARVLADQAVTSFGPQGYLRLVAWCRMLAAELARDDGDDSAFGRHLRVADSLFTRLTCKIGAARARALLSAAKPLQSSPS